MDVDLQAGLNLLPPGPTRMKNLMRRWCYRLLTC
jgi:hypothetical protein